MDDLDAAILREMLRDRAILWGGGDPRVAMTDLAKRLDVDRTTVWSHMRRWKREGFLVGQEVVPNPALFGSGLAVGDVCVNDPRRKAQALDALALVDGVLAVGDQVGPYVLLLYAHENPAALNRCTRLIGKLPGIDAVSMCIPFAPPRSDVEPTATDWRILAALRRSADRPLTEIAADAGISARTFTRRYGDLLDANAIWWFPIFDFARWRGAVMARFVVEVDPAAAVPNVINACQHDVESMVWWSAPPPEVAAMDDGDSGWFDMLCHLASAAEVEDVQRRLMDVAAVKDVEAFFPRSWLVVPTWFDERIAKHV